MKSYAQRTICRSLGVLVALSILCYSPFTLNAQEDECAESTEESKIAFISDREGTEQIYLMDSDGENLTQVTDFERAFLSGLDWSPDGEHLAFVDSGDIYLLHLHDSTIDQLTVNEGEDYSPAWSPDGQYIAYISARGGPFDIWVMDTYGANVRSMTYDPRWEITVEWTADGHGIAYVPNSGADLQIWLTAWDDEFDWETPFLFENPDNGILHSVTDLTWSPDGEHLALQSDYGAYVINVDGTDLIQIEDRETYSYRGAPSWSPDSCRIVFASNREENSEIYVLNLVQKLRNVSQMTLLMISALHGSLLQPNNC